jgi:ATP-dependent RNA helicase SUPV3L1/SUV3
MPVLPPEAAVVLATPAEGERLLLERLGYRPLGPQMLRVDLVERLARHAHQARAGKTEPVIDQALATSIGLQPPALARLMTALGFRPAQGAAAWRWHGPRRRPEPGHDPSHAFAALAKLKSG